jgi:hypothetical protein
MWDTGLFKDRTITIHICNALDAYLRLRHVMATDNYLLQSRIAIHPDRQAQIALSSICGHQLPMDFKLQNTLGADEAYKAIEAMAILDHPCQKCAEDHNAWHTRYGFCEHKEKKC